MQRLLLLGLNHSTAPLTVRERVAFTQDERRAALVELKQRWPDAEAVLICTCNRMELYVARPVHGRPRAEEMVEFIAERRGIAPADVRGHIYEKAEREAVEHLFTVASSLDSMVIGETQILGQVREAYDSAREAGVVGAGLNPLFQRALSVGKHVVATTPIAEGRASVASVAIECAQRIFDHFDDKTVLSIGAGKMASLVLRGFAALHPKRLLVSNRDPVKANTLAVTVGAEPAPFERLDEHLVAADIVVSSTGASQPIITRQRFEALLKQRRYRPVFLIDITLPRDIESAVGELENVYLYNLDDLQQVVASTRSHRTESVDAARAIVREHVERFFEWHRAREMGPFIDKLYQRHHQIALEELHRTVGKMGHLTDGDRAHLEELARRIVNKLLHEPVRSLREADAMHGPASTYLHALEKLFQLDGGTMAAEDRADGETEPVDPQHD